MPESTPDIFSIRPPDDTTALRILKRSAWRTRLIRLAVGALSGGLGSFMLVLNAFELDPQIKHMPTAQRLLGYAFALLFLLVGVAMTAFAVFSRGSSAGVVSHRLLRELHTLQSASRRVSTRSGFVKDPGPTTFGQHILVLSWTNNTETQLMMPANDVTLLLTWIETRKADASNEAP